MTLVRQTEIILRARACVHVSACVYRERWGKGGISILSLESS